MKVFYWVMAVLIGGTFAPSLLYFMLYVLTGADVCARRARAFWTASRVFAGLGINILIWGHVFVGLWQIWFH